MINNVRRPGLVADLRDWVTEVQTTDGYLYLVEEDDGALRGFGQFIWDPGGTERFVAPEECLIHSLYVDPDHWRQGVGTSLIEGGIERLPGHLSGVCLGVLKENTNAHTFYEACGFERAGESTYRVAGGIHDCYVYSRPLETSE